MPRATHKLTVTRRDGQPITPLRNSPTTSISVYGRRDLKNRTNEAKDHPEVTVSVERLPRFRKNR